MSVGEGFLFWILGPVMVVGATGLLFAKKAVHAALCMALVMVGMGVVYVGLQAPFLGAVQVFVYTGAVMMLFLFVLMLVGVDSSDSLVETIRGQRAVAAVLGLGLAATLVGVVGTVALPVTTGLDSVNEAGNIGGIATTIFGDYVFAFEVTGALLITAALGAMVMAHRERLLPKPGQRELSKRRILEGPVAAPLPSPGVFARHNAVDTPALLPDGTPCEESVSRVLRVRGQQLPAATRVAEIEEVEAELHAPLDATAAAPAGAGSAEPDDRKDAVQ